MTGSDRNSAEQSASCPSVELATAFAAGELDGAERERIEAHIDECAPCRQMSSDLARSGAPSPSPSPSPPPPPGTAFPPGNKIGRYQVLSELGRGGMGIVYAALDPELDRKVAVKLLRPSQSGVHDDAAHARLRHEGQLMARLSHRSVTTVYDVGMHGDQLYVAMELVEGTTLREWLKQPRTLRQIVHAFVEAGRGLACAHEAGLVHRDFKPENVLCGQGGRICVTDFGLARSAGNTPAPEPHGGSAEPASTGRLTLTGEILGTPAYLSPEACANAATDARSDQFSYCVAFYEAVFRDHPFGRVSLAELSRSFPVLQSRRRASGSRVPGWLRGALLRGLSMSPAERFPDMESLLRAIERGPRVQRARTIAIATVGVLALGGALTWHRMAVQEPAAQPVDQHSLKADHRLQTENAAEARLAEGDLEGGRALLEEALRRRPNAALARAALAGVLLDLGDQTGARRNAEQAYQDAADLPRIDLLLVQARRHESRGEWDAATAAWRARFETRHDLASGRGLVRALALANHASEAVAMVETLRRLPGADRDLRLELEAGDALRQARRHGDALTVFESVARSASAAGMDRLVVRALEGQASQERRLGHLASASATVGQALRLVDRTGARSEVARASGLLALIQFDRGDPKGAAESYEHARAAWLELGAAEKADEATVLRAWTLMEAGALAEAKSLLDAAGSSQTAPRDGRALVILRQVQGLMALREGDPALALRLLTESRGALGDVSGHARAYSTFLLGHVALARDELDDAARLYEEALHTWKEDGEHGFEARAQMALSQVAIERRAPDAEREAAVAEVYFHTAGMTSLEIVARTVRARALLSRGDSATALTLLEEIEPSLSKISALGPRLTAQILLCTARIQAGRADLRPSAIASLSEVATTAEHAGFVPEALEARIVLARALRLAGKPREADRIASTAAREAKDRGLMLLSRAAGAD